MASSLSSPIALANFLEDVGKYGPWWYGLNIDPLDENSFSKLFRLLQDRTMLLAHDAGWVWKKGKTFVMSIDGVNNFMKQTSLSYMMESTKICYNKKQGCLFVWIGSFGAAVTSPFSPLQLDSFQKPIIKQRILDRYCATLHFAIHMHCAGATARHPSHTEMAYDDVVAPTSSSLVSAILPPLSAINRNLQNANNNSFLEMQQEHAGSLPYP